RLPGEGPRPMRTTAERRTTISFSPSMTPRLAMRPSAPTDRVGPMQDGSSRALLDGAWWPRSVDPAMELPGLVLALQAQGPSDGHRLIVHIMLRATDWAAHPRRLRVDGPEDTREVLLSW